MSVETARNLKLAVQHLSDTTRWANWNELDALLSGYPTWQALAQAMRYPPGGSHLQLTNFGSPEQFQYLTAPARQRLLLFLLPYSILLDPELEPAQRAEALEASRFDTVQFCKENLRNGSPEIAGAARQVLEAHRTSRSLLRGSARAAEHLAADLPRVPEPGDADAQSLPRAADRASVDRPSAGGWLARLFTRR